MGRPGGRPHPDHALPIEDGHQAAPPNQTRTRCYKAVTTRITRGVSVSHDNAITRMFHQQKNMDGFFAEHLDNRDIVHGRGQRKFPRAEWMLAITP
jgi:hypothetical protein